MKKTLILGVSTAIVMSSLSACFPVNAVYGPPPDQQKPGSEVESDVDSGETEDIEDFEDFEEEDLDESAND